MAAGRLGSVQLGSGVKWMLGALAIFIVTETTLYLTGEEPYWISIGCLTILLAVAGWAIGHYRSRFEESLGALTAMTSIGGTRAAATHVEKWTGTLFNFWPWPFISAMIVGTAWVATLLALDPAFTKHWLNVGVTLFFVPIVVVGAWGSFVAVGAVLAVVQTANSGLEAPFSVVRDPVIASIERGWRGAGFFIVVVYVMLLTAFWQGPHALDGYLALWLAVFALLPLVWFVVGGAQRHRMLTALKDENVKVARSDVTRLADALAGDSSVVTLQEFNAALDIEAKAEAMPAWPSAPGGIASFILAVVPIIIQSSLVYAGVAESL
jgi:hypothetical protein